MKIIRDDIDKFYDYGIDVQTRTLVLGADCDEYTADYAVKGLHTLDRKGKGEITIKMINYGGDEYCGWGIYDAIRSCDNFVTIRAYGICASMGSLIFQGGDKRLMSPLCTMMIHYGTWAFEGHALDQRRSASEAKRHDEIMENVYMEQIKRKHPRYRKAQLREMLKFDTYLTPEMAIDLGLCDDTISYREHD